MLLQHEKKYSDHTQSLWLTNHPMYKARIFNLKSLNELSTACVNNFKKSKLTLLLIV